MKIAVVIAAYDEKENIGVLTSRLIQTLDGMHAAWTLIYVIEGVDGTLGLAQKFASERPEICILYNAAPSGLGRAFRMGFEAIPGDVDMVVTMDADLNHQPEEIPALIEAAEASGADLVIGSRRVVDSSVSGVPVWKTFTSAVVGGIMNIVFGVKVNDMTSGFRVYRATLLRCIHFSNNDFAFLPEIVVLAAGMGAAIIERPIRFTYREAGTSKMALWKTCLSYLKLFRQYLRHRRAAKILVSSKTGQMQSSSKSDTRQ